MKLQTLYPRKINNSGYYMIHVNDKWVLEHRFIVEEHINRPLKKEEAVHHIDFNKLNNDINNLFLFKSQKEHKSFENKFLRFGMTNPIKRMIDERWYGI